MDETKEISDYQQGWNDAHAGRRLRDMASQQYVHGYFDAQRGQPLRKVESPRRTAAEVLAEFVDARWALNAALRAAGRRDPAVYERANAVARDVQLMFDNLQPLL
ncbi:hypothetical protein PQ43W_9 [Ralstonia phage PQ43W]